MHKSLISHLFLPHDLPSSLEYDYLLKNKHENEHLLLHSLSSHLKSFTSHDNANIASTFSTILNTVEQWTRWQILSNFDVSTIQSILERLAPKTLLPLYLQTQNAAILIEISDHNNDQAFISAWQVSWPCEIITSSLMPRLSSFPVTKYRLNNRAQLHSKVNCELLVDLMHNTIEYQKSRKAGNEFDEIRDVPQSHYIHQWWIQHFSDITIENNCEAPYLFTKKHRDQIRWKKALQPFRRSGLWMVIKVVLQIMFTKQLKNHGLIIYKLFITSFLTSLIEPTMMSTDVLVHCLRKIVRRLNKIDKLLEKVDMNSLFSWIHSVKNEIQTKTNHLFPQPNWQLAIRLKNAGTPYDWARAKLELKDERTHQHACVKLNDYLQKTSAPSSPSSYPTNEISGNFIDVNQMNDIPSVAFFMNNFNYDVAQALIRTEIWVGACFDTWLNRSSQPCQDTNPFVPLLKFFEDYQIAALNHYSPKGEPTDPIGYSRYMLTSLILIRSTHSHLCRDPRFKRLKFHTLNLPHLLRLFEALILPVREDMTKAQNLYKYFASFSEKQFPDLLSDITSYNAFGVNFAEQSTAMKDSIKRIREEAESDKKRKIEEVKNAKDRYLSLMNSISNMSCKCYYTERTRRRGRQLVKCSRCITFDEAQQIKVSIYECPLPADNRSAFAAIFELQMPIEFRNYRDMLWLFINRPTLNPPHNMYEWLHVPPHSSKLSPYLTGPAQFKIKLVSSAKSITQSHYSSPPVATSPPESFLFENSLKVEISPTNANPFESEVCILTPVLNDQTYKTLEFSLKTTSFVQNQTISKLSSCSRHLRPYEFIEYGSFRSGHRLQWWNLLALLELDSLSLGDESVAVLLTHALSQYGPVNTVPYASSTEWCSESHEQLLEDSFIDELILRLNYRLNDSEYNWQNELVLLVITFIAVRVFTVCNVTRQQEVAAVILKCRAIGEKWMDLIVESFQSISGSTLQEMGPLRQKLVVTGISCILTFSTHSERVSFLMSSDDHVISLLKAKTTVHDNIVLTEKNPSVKSNTSIFLQNMIRYTKQVSITVQPIVSEYLHKTSYQSLNEFSRIYWAVVRSRGGMQEMWTKRRKDIFDGWYDCQYQGRLLSINFIQGDFLVDGMTVGFLPSKITNHSLFNRVFCQHVFEVQASNTPNTYITKYPYHQGRVFYEFCYNDATGNVTVMERCLTTSNVFQLIPWECLAEELPNNFFTDYSHWLNKSNGKLEFRSIRFDEKNFLDEKPYSLNINTGFLIDDATSENQHFLINQTSSFFEDLYSRYFIRLDDRPHVYMMQARSNNDENIVYIHLARLGIVFIHTVKERTIVSREYADMCIEQDQWIGTLTGLEAGLLLSPISVQTELRYCQNRKLIVPFGRVHVCSPSHFGHHTVAIQRASLQNDFIRHYFVFNLNDRLRILQSTNSPTGWLYLALLHAMTSHTLPDEYTEMTGMERAFQLLNSAGCYSDQPFDALSLNILEQIASISPSATYYPPHLRCMVTINWNIGGLSHSLQHFGYYLTAKNLLDTSEQLSFMYPSLTIVEKPQIFQGKTHDQSLLRKLYWDYRDSYNPMARLIGEMEDETLSTGSSITGGLSQHNFIDQSIYTVINITDGLYRSGHLCLRDCSNKSWLPLGQWLTEENKLNEIWIGLLKMAHQFKLDLSEEGVRNSQRYELLIDFLHYIANMLGIYPSYLQMLRTFLWSRSISLISAKFPPFIQYENIEETTFLENRINIRTYYSSEERPQIMDKIRRCWQDGTEYQDRNEEMSHGETAEINRQLQSWRRNAELRSFLNSVHDLIRSVPVIPFNSKVVCVPQRYSSELYRNHHQVKHNPTNKSINVSLLMNAKQKFHHIHLNPFEKVTNTSVKKVMIKDYPLDVLHYDCNPASELEELSGYFRNQLVQSWKRLLSDEQVENENPTIQQIVTVLNFLQRESVYMWEKIVQSIETLNELLYGSGLALRIVPTTLISSLQTKTSYLTLNDEQRTIIGGMMVTWTLEQHLERALYYASQQKIDEFKKEMMHVPHTNWIPSEHISWLILELEMNITIREMQIRVAKHMMNPSPMDNGSSVKNMVMQMNMGEGKTSIILPMLAVSLSESNATLMRIIVLKSLFPTNHNSLRYKLGGLLNRRIFPFTCRRDLNFKEEQIQKISIRFDQSIRNGDIVLTAPEDILSFDLLTIDKCRRKEFDVANEMLTIQRWLKMYARDVLDESDEILHVKYQLIYTVGGQQQMDGGQERWKTIQLMLQFLKKHSVTLFNKYSREVHFEAPRRQSGFPQIRLQSSDPYSWLCTILASEWLDQRAYRQIDRELIRSFLLDPSISINILNQQFSHHVLQLCLMVRGLLSSGVLLVALRKRYRVNYGVNPNPGFNRLMAVPFRAKDVAADRTEFGHPDVALVLTHLTYYYTGLSDAQLTECFRSLAQEKDPTIIYDQWVVQEDENEMPSSIKHWNGVNLKDFKQRTTYLFPTFRYNMQVINYFLNHFVFPREAKQFPNKLVASAWDIASSISRSKLITGFSGTNDTQLLLPIHMRQYDLFELEKTDAIVLNNLLQPENQTYQSLTIDATQDHILKQIVERKSRIHVILDVGAVFIDGTNRKIALQWLQLSDRNKIDYVVYFNCDEIVVCDRALHQQRFDISPASERLDRCLFYLDEIHTRGTDFKFPRGFQAALTLGRGLTKDRFVQAAMRMRKLGNGHSLLFFGSHEVHQQIIALKSKHNSETVVTLIDILGWVYQNTIESTWEGLHHWAAQSYSFQRKIGAFEKVEWENKHQTFTETLINELALGCLEPEIIELEQMYGASKSLQTLFELNQLRYQQNNQYVVDIIRDSVLDRLQKYGGRKQRLAQLLDEEQQRELEQELEEERQIERPSPVQPCEPILHEEIKRLCNDHTPMMNLSHLPHVFRPITYSFTDTSFANDLNVSLWHKSLWITTEFQRVVHAKGESLDPFLRPPRWLVIYRNEFIIFLSPLEANLLMKSFQSRKSKLSTLRILIPRFKRNQSIFINTPKLIVPPRINISIGDVMHSNLVPAEMLVQLFAFNGTVFFEDKQEQEIFCRYLCLCPKPRSAEQEKAFEKGWIATDGFISDIDHRRALGLTNSSLNANPLTFIRKLIEVRNDSQATTFSHIGSIILNCRKLL